MERCIVMTAGCTVVKMKREIQFIIQELPDIKEVYGFGSFFRSQYFNDIDLLFVLSCDDRSLLAVSKEVRFLISDASTKLGFTLHPLILTEREFGEAPLRDMHELMPFS
ncbi:MAG: hypothetical protein Kilf2KO_45050 [Rhodospirillales bacterium]